MTLVDTSVWIEHLRSRNVGLEPLLHDGEVLCHPFISGELACGNLRNREEVLALLASLPVAQVADHREVLYLLHSHRLYGQGIGWIDAHLLTSARLAHCRLWTMDQALRNAARRLRLET